MLQNFAAVRGEAKLIAPGRDGVDTLMLINAAYLSAWEGRKLHLPVDMEQYRAALRLKREDLLRYVDAVGHTPTIVDLPAEA